VNQNTEADKLWESLIKEKFPNASEHDLTEAKLSGSIAWMFGEKTVMSEIFDKYVMMKKLKGL
jgi:hypothetical protein